MKHYNNQNIRRQDRLLEESRAEELLKSGEYGILSMVTPEGEGYGIPLNYVWDEDLNSIYIHCAPEGKKLKCIAQNPNVSFTVVGRTKVIPDKFTTNYESVVLACTARTHLPEDERMAALGLILDKYAPEDKSIGLKYAQKSFHRTEILRLDIVSASGKCKRVHT